MSASNLSRQRRGSHTRHRFTDSSTTYHTPAQATDADWNEQDEVVSVHNYTTQRRTRLGAPQNVVDLLELHALRTHTHTYPFLSHPPLLSDPPKFRIPLQISIHLAGRKEPRTLASDESVFALTSISVLPRAAPRRKG